MEVIEGIFQQLVTALAGTSGWVQTHLSAISTAIVTTLLVIFGDEINGSIKKQIRNYNFLVRTAAFVALCVFGYGLLYFGSCHLPLTVIVAFIAMCMLAERKKYM